MQSKKLKSIGMSTANQRIKSLETSIQLANQTFKEEKTNLLHIATCKLLSPFGYYKFINVDEDGWPHYDSIKDLEELSPYSQEILMKKSIIQYFE